MRFAIRYLTEYRYEEPVTDNLNVLQVTPATTPTQEVDDFRVRIEPETRIHRHADYFGTQVIEFGVTRPHDHLTIDVRARVATASRRSRRWRLPGVRGGPHGGLGAHDAGRPVGRGGGAGVARPRVYSSGRWAGAAAPPTRIVARRSSA